MKIKRRDFITFLGGAAAWPLAARAQQGERIRRVSFLSNQDDSEATQARLAALRQALTGFGWIEGRNLQIDTRFAAADPDRLRAYAAQIVRLAPDLIVTASAIATKAVQQETQTIPIVITAVGDPVANGIVKSLAHPEGNTTGVTNLYASIGGKWLELLKEAAPNIEQVGLVYNNRVTPDETGYAYIPSLDESAKALGVRAMRIAYADAVDLVHAIDEFGAQPNGGLIMVPPEPTAANRQTIIRLAKQHHLPTVFQTGEFVSEGGLMAYGSDSLDLNRRAAMFVDRLLRGAKVSDLPVEFPTQFQLAISLKTARAIGLDVPATLLARADEVIE